MKFFAMDGLEYIKKTNEKYDIIYFDLTDPSEENPLSNVLYSIDTAAIIRERLDDDGIFVSLAYGKVNNKWKKSAEYLKNIFSIVRYYGVWIPSFGSYVIFVFASNKYDPLEISKDKIENKIRELELKYYNSLNHKLMFSLIF